MYYTDTWTLWERVLLAGPKESLDYHVVQVLENVMEPWEVLGKLGEYWGLLGYLLLLT